MLADAATTRLPDVTLYTVVATKKLWRCPPLAGAPGAAGSGQELTVPPRSVPARRVEEDNGTQ